MEQHHQSDQQRLAPHARCVVHQEHEGEEEREDVAERHQQVEVQHLPAELAREQADGAQQDAQHAQRQRFVLLREEVLPDHVIQRHADRADAGQQQDAHGRVVFAAVIQQQGRLPAFPAFEQGRLMVTFDFYQVAIIAFICNAFCNIKTDIDAHQSL
jgi:hypothetical protein